MKHNFINAVVLAVLWTALSGLSGCPIDTLKNSPPEIANLVYIPSQAPVDEGKTTPIIGSFNILNEGGETASIKTAAYDARGKQVASETMPLSDATLRTAKTLGFGFDMSTAQKGNYTFQVSIMDEKGRQSNKLDGTFSVTGLY